MNWSFHPALVDITLLMNNSSRQTFLSGLLILSLGSFSSICTADTAVEKIYIDADHVKLNIETGYSVYTGNVKITQGELTLTGDQVTVHQTNNEVERITVDGKPAHYSNITEAGDPIQAESEQMVYTASENKLVLTTNAELKQPDHTVKSQKIVYDTEKKVVIAGSKDQASSANADADTKHRVNITLTPKKDPAIK